MSELFTNISWDNKNSYSDYVQESTLYDSGICVAKLILTYEQWAYHNYVKERFRSHGILRCIFQHRERGGVR